MAPNSLYPAFVKIDYHSSFAPHTMTIPTRTWSADPGEAIGVFEDWNSNNRSGSDMVNDLVALMAPFFKPDTTFDLVTVYKLDTPTSDPDPVAAMSLGVDGTSVQTAWHKALQTTFTFRTDLFGIFRLVFLDAPSGGLFDRIGGLSASPEAEDIFDNLKLDTNAWAGRDGGRVNTFVQISYTLNEKLRREYNMT